MTIPKSAHAGTPMPKATSLMNGTLIIGERPIRIPSTVMNIPVIAEMTVRRVKSELWKISQSNRSDSTSTTMIRYW